MKYFKKDVYSIFLDEENINYKNRLTLNFLHYDEIKLDINYLKSLASNDEIFNAEYNVRLCVFPYFSSLKKINSKVESDILEPITIKGKSCVKLKKHMYQNLGLTKDIYTGFNTKKVSIDNNDNYFVSLNTVKNKVINFNINHLSKYLSNNIINEALRIEYDLLESLVLNVAITANIKNNNENRFLKDYYQISLFQRENLESSINIKDIEKIVFTLI